MKKLVFALAIAGLGFAGTSCKKETTCECQQYEIQDDGSEVAQGDPQERVIDSKNGDCSRFDDYDDNLVSGDVVTRCEEKVFD